MYFDIILLFFCQQGDYDIYLDMVDKTTTFLGPNFFYGSFEFKFTALNKIDNFICVESVMRIEKANKF